MSRTLAPKIHRQQKRSAQFSVTIVSFVDWSDTEKKCELAVVDEATTLRVFLRFLDHQDL